MIIASDGGALSLLQKEFPELESIALPSYNIEYSKKGAFFKLKLFFNLPHIRQTVNRERQVVEELVQSNRIQGIISDNRLGIHSEKIPSVYITHQLNVLSGSTSWVSSKAHRKVIRKFDECWVPDIEGQGNLSGRLGHLKDPIPTVRYIGPLSRMKKQDLQKKYDVLCILSGPEPQRELLEKKLIHLFSSCEKEVILVRGIVNESGSRVSYGKLTILDYLTSKDLEKVINESEIIISRSGYTTIMDLAVLDKKVFFIPTPGQYEQKYLANRLKNQGLVPYCEQNEFSLEKLDEIQSFKGLSGYNSNVDLKQLFHLFEGE